MQVEPSDRERIGTPPIWNDFERIVKQEEGDWVKITPIERQKVRISSDNSILTIAH